MGYPPARKARWLVWLQRRAAWTRPWGEQRRCLHQRYLQKVHEAQQETDERAQRIKEGTEVNLFDALDERGLVKDTIGTKEQIREIMRTKRISAYCGVDATAKSMHVGHLLPIMPLIWMYAHGYGAISLLGGSTARIGDPTGRLESREQLESAQYAENIVKLHYQLKKIWNNAEILVRECGFTKKWAWKRGIVNNNAWWNRKSMLEVIKRVGHSVRMGPMLSRDTVKRKMTEGDGMSFAEFSYPIFQGWDWYELMHQQNVQMQIGGSDQYGNIVLGAEVVKAARASERDPRAKLQPISSPLEASVGFTVPLLTDKSGQKFGKTAGNAVWLDAMLTTPFDLYGYFVRRPDDEMQRLLNMFTLLPLDRIAEVMEEHAKDPSKRVPHHILAHNVLTLVHGPQQAQQTQRQHQEAYSSGFQSVGAVAQAPSDKEQPTTLNNAPPIDLILPKSLILGNSVAKIVHAAGLAPSRSEAQRMILKQNLQVGAAPGQKPSINKGMNPEQVQYTPMKLWFPSDTPNFLIGGNMLLLRKGRHNIRIIKMVSDEEYERSGQTYPNQPGSGKVRQLRKRLAELQAAKEKHGGSVHDAAATTEIRHLHARLREEVEEDSEFPETRNEQLRKLRDRAREEIGENDPFAVKAGVRGGDKGKDRERCMWRGRGRVMGRGRGRDEQRVDEVDAKRWLGGVHG